MKMKLILALVCFFSIAAAAPAAIQKDIDRHPRWKPSTLSKTLVTSEWTNSTGDFFKDTIEKDLIKCIKKLVKTASPDQASTVFDKVETTKDIVFPFYYLSLTPENAAELASHSADLGYRYWIDCQGLSEFHIENFESLNIPYTTYQNAPVTDMGGRPIGSVQIPQQQNIYIPARQERFLYTEVLVSIHDLTKRPGRTLISSGRLQAYHKYRGGDCAKAVSVHAQTVLKELLKP